MGLVSELRRRKVLRIAALYVAAAWLAACGGGSNGGAGLPSGSGQPPQNQPPPNQLPGLSLLTFDHNGTERQYHLHIPANYDGSNPVPLLFDFHGLNGTSESEFNQSRFNRIADREGFILVTPQALDGSWQLATKDDPQPFENQDIDYVLSLLDRLKAEFIVDEERLYLAGLSRGAYFSFEIACQRSDVFAAVSAVVWWALGRRESESRFEVLRTLLGSPTALAPSPSEHP